MRSEIKRHFFVTNGWIDKGNIITIELLNA